MVNGVDGLDGMSRSSSRLVHYVAFILCAAELGKVNPRVVAKHEWGKRRMRTRIMMSMVSITQGWSTSLHGSGNGGLSAMSGHALQRSCTAMCVFCSTLLSFAFADRLGINPMDLGLMY